MVATTTTAFAANDCYPQSFNYTQATTNCQPTPTATPCTPTCAPASPWAVSTFGIALEQVPTRNTNFLYWAQTIKGTFYYELRAYAILNFINASPAVPVAVPVRDQRNVWGTGGVGIFGYIFKIPCSKATFMPFFRYEARSNNTGVAYRDTQGNRLTAWSYAYFFGAKLDMPINELFSLGVQYWGGYVRVAMKGKGYFANTVTPGFNASNRRHANTLVGNLMFYFHYNVTKCVYVTPYLQMILSDNNPGPKAYSLPYRFPQFTTSTYLWGLRVGYKF